MGRKDTWPAKEPVNDGATEGMCAVVAGHQWSCVGKQSSKEKMLVKISKLIFKLTFCFYFLRDTMGSLTFQLSHDVQGSIFSLFWSRFRCLVHHWDAPRIITGNQVLVLMLNADVQQLLGQSNPIFLVQSVSVFKECVTKQKATI